MGQEAGDCLGCSVDTQPRFLVGMGTENKGEVKERLDAIYTCKKGG